MATSDFQNARVQEKTYSLLSQLIMVKNSLERSLSFITSLEAELLEKHSELTSTRVQTMIRVIEPLIRLSELRLVEARLKLSSHPQDQNQSD